MQHSIPRSHVTSRNISAALESQRLTSDPGRNVTSRSIWPIYTSITPPYPSSRFSSTNISPYPSMSRGVSASSPPNAAYRVALSSEASRVITKPTAVGVVPSQTTLVNSPSNSFPRSVLEPSSSSANLASSDRLNINMPPVAAQYTAPSYPHHSVYTPPTTSGASSRSLTQRSSVASRRTPSLRLTPSTTTSVRRYSSPQTSSSTVQQGQVACVAGTSPTVREMIVERTPEGSKTTPSIGFVLGSSPGAVPGVSRLTGTSPHAAIIR